jgi:hypothetical protein
MPSKSKTLPRFRQYGEFVAIAVTVIVERDRVEEITRAATDAAANVDGAIGARAVPVVRQLTRDEWRSTDEIVNLDARMARD